MADITAPLICMNVSLYKYILSGLPWSFLKLGLSSLINSIFSSLSILSDCVVKLHRCVAPDVVLRHCGAILRGAGDWEGGRQARAGRAVDGRRVVNYHRANDDPLAIDDPLANDDPMF